MGRATVLVTDHVFASLDTERSTLAAVGAELVVLSDFSERSLLAHVRTADALLVCYAQIRERVMAQAPRLRIIARYGIGVDNIDVAAATARGIIVTNVPDYCIEEVSDHTLALLLACARKVVSLNRSVHAQRWDAIDARPISRLNQKVLGLVGFGKIARALATKVRPLGLRIVVFDPYVDAEMIQANQAEKVDLPTLVRTADFVSLHVPLTDETFQMIGERELRAMKPSGYLINTARGQLVKPPALLQAVREGWIAGAALDVLPEEPPEWTDPLLGLDNVIITPHVAFYSEESQIELQRKAAEEVARVLTDQPPLYPVNRIEIS